MTISITQAREADWREVRSIRLRALLSDPSVYESSHRAEAMVTEADWRSRLKTEDAAVFLICDGTSVIVMTGIAVYRDDPSKRTAVMWGSWLDPRARGQGLSDAMYRERIAWAKAHPTIDKIVVSHRASNLVSRSTNQRYEFKYTHAETRTWPDGQSEDNVFYSLDVKRTR